MTTTLAFLGYMIVGTFFLGYNDIQNKKYLARGIDERLLVSIPFLIAGPLLLLLLIPFGIPQVQNAFWPAFVTTSVLNVISQAVFMRAFKLAEASIIAPLRLTIPIIVVVTGFVFLGERPSLVGISGIVITMSGLWLLLFSGTRKSLSEYVRSEKGVMLGLLGSVLFALSFPFDKITVITSSALFASGLVAVTVGACSLLIHMAVSKEFRMHLGTMRTHWRSFLSTAVVRAAGITLTNQALAYSLVAYASSLKRLAALWTVGMSGAFLNEKDLGKKLIATAIMFVGIILSVVVH